MKKWQNSVGYHEILMICTCIVLYYWVPKHSIRNETPQRKSKIDNLALELEGIESLWRKRIEFEKLSQRPL